MAVVQFPDRPGGQIRVKVAGVDVTDRVRAVRVDLSASNVSIVSVEFLASDVEIETLDE